MVPTRDGAARMPRLLAALRGQDITTLFEVVVVDDGSTPPLRLDTADLPIRCLRHETSRGPAAARNTGWRASKAPLVAFTDDDCAPQPGWLRSLAAGLEDADVVQGRTEPDPEQDGQLGPFSHLIGVTSETGFYETCNIGYRRELLARLGGFDEGFRYPFGEDTDLAWRAKAAGARTAFAADAVVLHDVTPSDFGAHLRRLRRREGLVMAIERHPELRAATGLGLFLRPTHLPALTAAGAGVAFVTKPSVRTLMGAAAAGAWYARTCRWNTFKPPQKRDWAKVVPLRFVADLWEIAVLARASVRYGAVLL